LAGAARYVTYDELGDLLVWRDGRSPNGRAALRQLLELRVLRALAEERNVEITEDMLRKRFDELDAEARANGVEGGLASYIEAQGVAPDEFRRYLRLSMVHEELTRRALDVPAGTEVTADQQQLWLENELKEREYVERDHPWAESVVCSSGDVVITREEFEEQLREQVDDEDAKEALYLILLERAVRARMPEVTDDGVEAALDREIERRAEEARADVRYEGVAYEELLDARGLSLEALRRDPAIRAAALAHVAIDRQYDEDALRAFYETERDLFDGIFGESVEVRVYFRNASSREGDQIIPSFEAVEEEVQKILEAIATPDDFARAVELSSEDRGTKEKGGLLGRVARGTPGAPPELVEAVFAELDAARVDPERKSIDGTLIGPVRLKNGVVIAMLSDRRPAPTWDGMRGNVHRELRRRFVEETLPRSSVLTYLDVR
ncbi:MAG: peptidylprolyl isomerase, partial [Planctomycetota bacterium]